ncbi:hypothetical protein [Parabacteroides sp.]
MKKDIERLRKRFVNAGNEQEEEQIDKEMRSLMDKDIDAFAEGLLECVKDTNKKVEESVLRDKLESVLPFISVSTLAWSPAWKGGAFDICRSR